MRAPDAINEALEFTVNKPFIVFPALNVTGAVVFEMVKLLKVLVPETVCEPDPLKLKVPVPAVIVELTAERFPLIFMDPVPLIKTLLFAGPVPDSVKDPLTVTEPLVSVNCENLVDELLAIEKLAA